MLGTIHMTALRLVLSISSAPCFHCFFIVPLSGIPCVAVMNWIDVGEYFGDNADI